MDIADLKIFAAVARTGAISRAASELNTVQSNVTTRILLLEREVGLPLFLRHARGVTITAAGQRLLPYATKACDILLEARRAVADDGHPKGALALGALETTAGLRLPSLLATFVSAYPQVDLTLTTGATSGLICDVLEGRLDGAFVAGPVVHPQLLGEAIFHEELALVTAAAERSVAALLQRTDLKIVVYRAGCSYRQRLEALLARRGIINARRLEFGTIEGIIGCVAAGIGLTMLPKSVVAAACRAGIVGVHELPAAEAWVDTLFIRRLDAFLPSALGAFLACARAARPHVMQAAE